MKTDQILQRNYDLETGDFERKIRADERQKLLSKVEVLLVDEKSKKYTEKQWCKCGSLPNDDGYCEDCRRKVIYKDIYMEDEADTSRNELRAELRAKLAEMRGGE